MLTYTWVATNAVGLLLVGTPIRRSHPPSAVCGPKASDSRMPRASGGISTEIRTAASHITLSRPRGCDRYQATGVPSRMSISIANAVRSREVLTAEAVEPGMLPSHCQLPTGVPRPINGYSRASVNTNIASRPHHAVRTDLLRREGLTVRGAVIFVVSEDLVGFGTLQPGEEAVSQFGLGRILEHRGIEDQWRRM